MAMTVFALRYTAPALAKKAGVGFDSPNAQAAMAAIEPQFLRPFTFVPQFMAARMGGRKPCRFMAPPVRRSVNPFGLPPMFDSVVGSCSQAQLEPIMTQSALALQLGNTSVRQINGLYSLNDLHRASGGEAKHRPNYFLGLEQTKDLTAEIEKAGIPAISAKPKVGTFACKELVIAYAAWISAAFHLKVIRVFLATVQPKRAYSALPYSSVHAPHLNAAQAEALRSLLEGFAQALPQAQRKQVVAQGMRKLRAYFNAAFHQIPQDRFYEAVGVIGRHIAQWANSLAVRDDVQAVTAPATDMGRLLMTAGQILEQVGAQGGNGRVLVYQDHEGKVCYRAVADDALVLSAQQWIDGLSHDLMLSTEQLMQVVLHAQQRLHERACFYEKSYKAVCGRASAALLPSGRQA